MRPAPGLKDFGPPKDITLVIVEGMHTSDRRMHAVPCLVVIVEGMPHRATRDPRGHARPCVVVIVEGMQ